MKSLVLVRVLAFAVITLATVAAQAKILNREDSSALYTALRQADLPVKKTLGRDPDSTNPETAGTTIVDQKIAVTHLTCDLRRDQMGTELGRCTLVDMKGKKRSLGSAASVQMTDAIPDRDVAMGHITGHEESVACEIDIRKIDSTGSATISCDVR